MLLTKNILNTVCYYDAMNYPLTVFEIWKYLVCSDDDNCRECALVEVLEKMQTNEITRFVKNKNGFYFLKGRDNLVNQRIERDKISVRKLKKMRRTIWWLRFSPFVRLILVTGRLAMKNAEAKSDWDVLIVLQSGRIWIGRTMITVLTQLLGKRRYGRKLKNRVCLNYFVTTNSLEVRNQDLFSASEYYFCLPIFDTANYFEKFQIKNSWIKKYKPNYHLCFDENLKAVMDTILSKKLRTFFERIVDSNFIENKLAKWELAKIKKNPKTSRKNSYIEADEKALIFLPDPHGPKVFEKFKGKTNRMGI